LPTAIERQETLAFEGYNQRELGISQFGNLQRISSENPALVVVGLTVRGVNTQSRSV
jgi:hypothetical protein